MSTPSTAPALRDVVADGNGTWTWRLSSGLPRSGSGDAPAGAPHGDPAGPPPAPGPTTAACPAREALRFLRPSTSPGGDRYAGVRGAASLADALRSGVELDHATTSALARLAVRAVAERPRVPPSSSPPSLSAANVEFLRCCDERDVVTARAVRDALAGTLPDGAWTQAHPARVLGLGRVVPCDGAAGADVLVPAGASHPSADAARVVAELHLTATLFAAAGKPNAPSTRAVRDVVAADLAALAPPAVVALLVVDHARRLAAHRGFDAPSVGLELAVAAGLLGIGAGTGPPPQPPAGHLADPSPLSRGDAP